MYIAGQQSNPDNMEVRRHGEREGGREGTGTHILYVRYIILLRKRKAGRERGTKQNKK